MNQPVLVIAALACAFVQPALAQTPAPATRVAPPAEPSVGLKIVDALFVRPPCVVGAGAATAAYVLLALPAHIMGYSEVLSDYLVDAPWHFVSGRDLGQFNDLTPLPAPAPR
ncbi:MAG: hypothetical protein EXR83_06020 [Gammaproteobacteria bacterium]|nr:hypothetical protein [Gammaproteobacteria bacterium]